MSEARHISETNCQTDGNSGTRNESTNPAKSVAKAIPFAELVNFRLFHSTHRLRGQQPVIGNLEFTTAEHASLGDNLCLKIPNPDADRPGQECYQTWETGSNKFHFNKIDSTLNHQVLSYGEINALAGDYYATYEPISGDTGKDHPCKDEAGRRFLEAWKLFAIQPRSVHETKCILAQNKEFEDDVLKEYKGSLDGRQVSWIYATKMVSAITQTEAFREITNDREGADYGNQTYPSYLGILLKNFDHFGHDAHFAYATGHRIALEVAVEAGQKNDEKKLMLAYAMNAFAEHYLEDAFSAGHLRTPRRALHDSGFYGYSIPALDLCANLMHNEDCAIGVKVRNKRKDKPDTWICVGDDYIHDKNVNAETTLCLCKEALQASADEIWDAYHTGKVLEPEEYKALTIAPDPDSALEKPQEGEQLLAPLYKLFDSDLKERNWSAEPFIGPIVQLNRTDWSDDNYTDFGFLEAAWHYGRLNNSGWWNYPLQLDAASPDPS